MTSAFFVYGFNAIFSLLVTDYSSVQQTCCLTYSSYLWCLQCYTYI